MPPGHRTENSHSDTTGGAEDADPSATRSRDRVRLAAEATGVILFYLVIVVLATWPLVGNPFHHLPTSKFPLERADQNLVIWILAWDWHALFSDPLAIFDANVSHPARHALAYAEHMLGVVPLFGPVYALSGNPVLSLNVAHVLTLTFSGASMYALLRSWGVVRAGALFGGFVYALYPGSATGSASLQMQSRQYLPLVLIFLDRTLQGGRFRSAIALSLFLLWQMLCSVYLAFIHAIGLAAYATTVLLRHGRSVSPRGVGLAALAVVFAAAVLLPIHLPYFELTSAGIIPDYSDTLFLTYLSSDFWRNWLIPPIALREWGAQLVFGPPSYLGVLPLLAAGSVALLPRRESTRWAASASLAIGVVGYLFALGPGREILGHPITFPFGLLIDWVPGFSSMRAPGRFAAGVMVGLSALAGIGLGRVLYEVEKRARRSWPGIAITAFLLVATAVEYDLPFDLPRGRRVPTGNEVPIVYTTLEALPDGPVLELPWFESLPWFSRESSSRYMHYSTYHWKRLLNGYGYWPKHADWTDALARSLPDERSIEVLVRSTGLRYVLVHLDTLPPEARSRWSENPAGLRLIERSGTDLLFGVEDLREPDLLVRFRDGPPTGYTVLGMPIDILPPEDRRGDLSFVVPPMAEARMHMPVYIELEVTNPTDRHWPAMTSDVSTRVSLSYRLFPSANATGSTPPVNSTRLGPLPFDLGPGESVRMAYWIQAPAQAGDYRLQFGIEQADTWFSGSTLQWDIHVEPARDR